MPKEYSQLTAMLAITRASLLSTFKSPQSIFFGVFFPVVLIVIFGSLSKGGSTSIDVAFEKNTDATTLLYTAMKAIPVLHFIDPNKKNIEDELKKGRITAIISLRKIENDSSLSSYDIHLRTTSASQRSVPILQSLLRNFIHDLDQRAFPQRKTYASISQEVVQGRRYKMIDFFLPGMIGFSLIGTAIFGVAFLFFSLRETLVLKRLYSTPIKRGYIVAGESLSKVLFQLITVVVLILFGYFAYGFTLANGWITFLEMIILSCLALMVFMGFGFLVSGISKNQNVIPIYSNLFMFPQYFLSGTFFPTTSLPESIQPFIKLLPLTAFNDALRNVAFEGAHLGSCWEQILILFAWGLVIYFVTIKVFRWE
jgi:ABC-2 type transport system permease protein